jgi:hypothetical protein
MVKAVWWFNSVSCIAALAALLAWGGRDVVFAGTRDPSHCDLRGQARGRVAPGRVWVVGWGCR